MPTELSKLDVARRQLAVAIRLFFDDRDPVSVHTLAANAWEIVDVLCTRQRVNSLSGETRGHLAAGRSLKHDLINEPYRNFFEHADRDPEGTIEGFGDEMNDHVLMLAVEDLLRVEETKLLECQIFQKWYLAAYPEKIAPGDVERVLPAICEMLPGLVRKSRSEQKKMGRELLRRAGDEQKLVADPLTDTSDFDRWRSTSLRRTTGGGGADD